MSAVRRWLCGDTVDFLMSNHPLLTQTMPVCSYGHWALVSHPTIRAAAKYDLTVALSSPPACSSAAMETKCTQQITQMHTISH